MSLPALREHLTRTAIAFDAGTAWAFSIFDAEETRILGGAGLEPADNALSALVGPGTFETGYWLRADATGHGYASEATAALIELAFARLDARRVAICHDPANRASKGVPERLGFRCIGTVTHDQLPGRQTADGSARLASTVWVIEAAGSTQRHTVDLSPSRSS
jgi:RimJ/RimL family protein N-acetyltransferase